MKKILFLCTANSCRSQIAEGFAREFGKGIVEVHSAGLMAAGVHPRAITVMKELGIDISEQKSKTIDTDLFAQMDLVIILCSNVEKFCPRAPSGMKRLFWPIRDPVGTIGTEKQKMKDFRRARDEIKAQVEWLIREIAGSETQSSDSAL